LKSKIIQIKSRYWPLIKSLQTGLLLATGLAGFMSARCPVIHWATLASLSGSLFLAISGSTMLNMWYDRDIDACMQRTCNRPLSSGGVSPENVLRLGILMSLVGVSGALAMAPLYGMIVFSGWFFDLVVYTVWLKRRSAWSIVWGGIAGGMPILAGRALATGRIDLIGIALALAVLFWIPTHILTFAIRHSADYQSAGIPTLVSHYGSGFTRGCIAVSSMLAALAMSSAAAGIGVTGGPLHLLGLSSGGLLLLAVYSLLQPSDKVNFHLFKYASIYMMFAMLIITLVAL
jgi:heme o synthase